MTPGDMNQDPRCDRAPLPAWDGPHLPLATFSRWMGPIALVAAIYGVVMFAGPYVKAFGEGMGAGW